MKFLLILLLACMLLASAFGRPMDTIEAGAGAKQPPVAAAATPKSPHRRALEYRSRRAAKKDSSSAIKDMTRGRPR